MSTKTADKKEAVMAAETKSDTTLAALAAVGVDKEFLARRDDGPEAKTAKTAPAVKKGDD